MTSEPDFLRYRQPEAVDNLTLRRQLQDSLRGVDTSVDIDKVSAFSPAKKIDVGAIAGQLTPESGTGLRVSANLGKLDEGLRKLREQEDNAKLRRLLEMAQLKIEQKRFQTALTLLDQVLAIHDTSATAWLLKGQCHLQLGDFNLTLAELKTAQEHAQDQETVMLVLMLRAECERAIVNRVESELAELLDAGEFDKAMTIVERALQDQPRSATLLFHRCGILFVTQRLADARAATEEARTLVDPHNVHAFDTLLRHIAMEESESCLEAARQALRRCKPNDAIRQLEACASELKGDGQFKALWSYAYDRVANAANALRAPIVRARMRRANVHPLDGSALQPLLGWLLHEELLAGSAAINRATFRRANEYFRQAERIDDRCNVIAFLHAATILGELQQAFDSSKPASYEWADENLSRAAKLANQGIHDPDVGAQSRTLATVIARHQRDLNRARQITHCFASFNAFVALYQRSPIRTRPQLVTARNMLERIQKDVARLRNEPSASTNEAEMLAELNKAISVVREKLS